MYCFPFLSKSEHPRPSTLLGDGEGAGPARLGGDEQGISAGPGRGVGDELGISAGSKLRNVDREANLFVKGIRERRDRLSLAAP